MEQDETKKKVWQRAYALLQEARELADDYGPAVRAEIDAAEGELLDDEQATQLFTRILVVLKTGDANGRTPAAAEVSRQVRREVEALVHDRRVTEQPREEIKLVEHNGLRPHQVVPVPSFSGSVVPMQEGYVDVRELRLGADNSRIDLYVKEFEEREHREPDSDDVLGLVQGKIKLQNMTKRDPFKIIELARSVARKGVERPPIVTWQGELKDGNRRIAAARWVMQSPEFNADEKENARWVRVWKAPQDTTDDQFTAIVVAHNFEDEHKEPWPEYVKARLVAERFHAERDSIEGVVTAAMEKQIRQDVAVHFAITPPEIVRYVRMVQWADEFEAFHTEERGLDTAAVRYKSNDIFQWFYEIEAGRGSAKLTEVLERDPSLKPVVYDLMYHVLDSGAQLRNLHKVVRDESALEILERAYTTWDSNQSADTAKKARDLVDEAILEAKKNSPSPIGFEMFVKTAIQKFGKASPDQWGTVKREDLVELARVIPATFGAVKARLATLGLPLELDVE